jgi:hypothetical protein
LSFHARAALLPARIEDVRLEAGGRTLCAISVGLTAAMEDEPESRTEEWPADLEATEMTVALPIAFDPGNTATARETFYDRVQVEERGRVTEWNDSSMLRREHDLAPYKKESDIFVLEYAATSGVVRVNGAVWLQDLSMSSDQKALFGWEPRVDSVREGEAGTFSTDANDYPPEWPVPAGEPGKDPLPPNFDNAFYNGYRRGAHIAHTPSYLTSTDLIEIERNGSIDYAFRLYGETIAATCRYYGGSGPDLETRWKRLDVPMRLDTLVIEPELDRCAAVWRGVWDYDSVAEDAYRRLTVTAT